MIDLPSYSNYYWFIVSVGCKFASRQRPCLYNNCVDHKIILQLLLHFCSITHTQHVLQPNGIYIDISVQCLWMHWGSAVDEAEGLWLPKADINLAHLWAIPHDKK